VAQYWVTRGYEGAERTFERHIPVGHLSEKEVEMLLKRLAARHLTEDEIVDSSLRKNAAGYAPHLEVHSGRDGMSTIGTDFHYIAVVRDIA
jgi:hypothetical protein